MKLSKILATVIGCTLMITACNETKPEAPAGNSNFAHDGDVIDWDDITITGDDDDEEEDEIVEKTCKEISAGQCGGSLTDLLVGSYIEPDYDYTCSFSHTKTFDGEYTITSDDRATAQVTHEPGTNSFVVRGITPGDAIIRAITSEDEVVLQIVVHVRSRIPMEKIAKKLYKVDKFTGMGYGYKLSFVETDPLKAILVGNDDFENSYVNFKLIDGVEEKINPSVDFNTYKFKISVDTEASITSRTYSDIYIATTGEKIYMYYSNGLVDIFTSYGLSIYSARW